MSLLSFIRDEKGQLLKSSLDVVVLLMLGLTTAKGEEATIRDRLLHHRAIDAVVWAMPVMNFKFYRDALIDAWESLARLWTPGNDHWTTWGQRVAIRDKARNTC